MAECEKKLDRDWFWAHLDELSTLRWDPDTQRFVPRDVPTKKEDSHEV